MPVRIALASRSAGSRCASRFGPRHQTRPPIVPALLNASSQNGAAMPNAPVITPLNAGPIARLILMPTLLAATAAPRSRRGTSSGTIDCHAGAVSALPILMTNMNASSETGVTNRKVTIAANTADTRMMPNSTAIRNRRLSMMSANAPAGTAKRNIGRPVATWTSDTISGSLSKLVINHAAAALYIQPPIFATTVAVQMTVYVRLRNGRQAEAVVLASSLRPCMTD